MMIFSFVSGAVQQRPDDLRARASSGMRMRQIAVASFLAFTMGTTQAQTEQGNESTLHEILVKNETSKFTAASVIKPESVLNPQALGLQLNSGLGAMLANEPGIHSSHFGAGASRPILRGLDGARTQILSNANLVQDASSASPDHAVMVDAQQTQSFEILRGPAALAFSAGSAGGLVNAIDESIPTAIPTNGYQGTVQAGLQSGNSNRQGAFNLTTGSGPLALRVAASGYSAKDYHVGSGWEEGSRVHGSFTHGESGSVGLSWVGRDAFMGISYSRQSSRYGLAGHSHVDCHPHGNHLHCAEGHGHAGDHVAEHHEHEEHVAHESDGGHAVHEAGDADHEHANVHGHIPTIHMRSHQWNLRGAWLYPVQGIAAVRWQGNLTRYGHEELDEGAVGTKFRHRSHQWRMEIEHVPTHGWSGLWGIQNGFRNSSIAGDETTVEPHDVRHTALFWLERWNAGNWTLQGALRHERQSVYAFSSAVTREHSGNSTSLLGQWRFQPGWQASVGYTHAKRLPTAEELFSNGPHLATNAWERGDASLRAETHRAWDVGIAKTSGNTSGSINVFSRRYDDYVYGETLDMHDGYRLLQYTQSDARFTGLEWTLKQQLHRNWAIHLWGDAVTARLRDGSALPRIAPMRTGIKLQADWQAWQGHVEWVQSARQRRVAVGEAETAAFGMLNAGVRYRTAWNALHNVEWSVQGRNLTNRLGYAHSSYIKHAAPLQGRSIHVSMKVDF